MLGIDVESVISQWVEEKCVLGSGKTKTKTLYEAFVNEQGDNGPAACGASDLSYDDFAKALGAMKALEPLKLKKAYKVRVATGEDEPPTLLPAVGSEFGAAHLVCPKINIAPREQPDGSYRFSQIEWLVDVLGFKRPVSELEIWGTFLEIVDLCQTPVSLYGKVQGSNEWQRLEMDDSGSQDALSMDGSEGWSEDEAQLLQMLESGDKTCADEILKKLQSYNSMQQQRRATQEMTDALEDVAMEEDEEGEEEYGSEGDAEMDDMEDVNFDVQDAEDDYYDQLCFGVPLVADARQDESQSEILDEMDLTTMVKMLKSAAKALGADTVQPRTSVKEGATRACAMADVIPSCEQEIHIFLRSSEGHLFDYTTVWDCLLSLGLEYDSDDHEFVYCGPVFNCHNSKELGISSRDAKRVGVVNCKEERLFFVSVKDEEGKTFFPEAHSKANSVKEVKFGFYAPYCPGLRKVFKLMVKGAIYCHGRLGGKLIDDNGEEMKVQERIGGEASPKDKKSGLRLDLQGYEERIQHIIDLLAKGGLETGDNLVYNIL